MVLGALPLRNRSASFPALARSGRLRETFISTVQQKTQSAYRTVSLSGGGIVQPASRLYRAVEGSGRHPYPQVNRKPRAVLLSIPFAERKQVKYLMESFFSHSEEKLEIRTSNLQLYFVIPFSLSPQETLEFFVSPQFPTLRNFD